MAPRTDNAHQTNTAKREESDWLVIRTYLLSILTSIWKHHWAQCLISSQSLRKAIAISPGVGERARVTRPKLEGKNILESCLSFALLLWICFLCSIACFIAASGVWFLSLITFVPYPRLQDREERQNLNSLSVPWFTPDWHCFLHSFLPVYPMWTCQPLLPCFLSGWVPTQGSSTSVPQL